MHKGLYGQKYILNFSIKCQSLVLSHGSLDISLKVFFNFENFENFMLHLVEGGVNFAKEVDGKLDFSSFILVILCFGPKSNL